MGVVFLLSSISYSGVLPLPGAGDNDDGCHFEWCTTGTRRRQRKRPHSCAHLLDDNSISVYCHVVINSVINVMPKHTIFKKRLNDFRWYSEPDDDDDDDVMADAEYSPAFFKREREKNEHNIFIIHERGREKEKTVLRTTGRNYY